MQGPWGCCGKTFVAVKELREHHQDGKHCPCCGHPNPGQATPYCDACNTDTCGHWCLRCGAWNVAHGCDEVEGVPV